MLFRSQRDFQVALFRAAARRDVDLNPWLGKGRVDRRTQKHDAPLFDFERDRRGARQNDRLSRGLAGPFS